MSDHLDHRGHWDAQGSGDWHCSEHREPGCSCIAWPTFWQIESLSRWGGYWTTEGLGDANEFATEEEAVECLRSMIDQGIWDDSTDDFRIVEVTR